MINKNISYIKSIFLVILIFSIPYTLLAQNPEWVVYDTSNSSLPSNRVTPISEDLDGNIWDKLRRDIPVELSIKRIM